MTNLKFIKIFLNTSMIILSSLVLAGCVFEEAACPIRDDRYKDIKSVKFSVNDDKDLYQNYSPYSLRDKKNKATTKLLWEDGTTSDGKIGFIKLKFQRISLDNNCKPEVQHSFVIQCLLNQLPTERNKTYQVGFPGLSDAPASAFYIKGKLLKEGEVNRTALNDAGTITIKKWIPGNIIIGEFDINIDGILVKGEFDYDLTNDYLEI